MTTQTVTIRYKIDSSGALVATGAVVKTVQQVGQAAAQSNKALAAQQSQIKSLQGALSNYTQQLRSLFGLYLTFQGIQTFANFVDEFTNLNGRLAVTITNTQAYAQAQRDVYAISQATYTNLASTANLYARLAVSLEELNSSQAEVAQITKVVNQALLVSGATTAEASSAIIQLSQSFASGVLRGEEFNAVNEAAPRIMAALAKSLGVSRGALREMASEGKLTAEVLRKALVDDALNIAKEAENVPLTIGRGYTSLRNDLLNYIGAANEVYNVSGTVAEGLVSLGQNLQGVASAFTTALSAVAVFVGAKGIAGLVISITTGVTTLATFKASLMTLGLALGGWPALIGGAVVALYLFKDAIFSVGEVSDRAAESLDKLKLLMKIDPDAAAKLAVQVYRELGERIKEVRAEMEKKSAESGWLNKGLELTKLNAELHTLEKQFQRAGKKLESFDDHAQRVSRAVGKASNNVQAFANSQRTLNATLVASGTPLGNQIKAAEELKAGLMALDEQLKKEPALYAVIDKQKKQLISQYGKELAAIQKSNKANKETTAQALTRVSAEERLTNIISQYTREQDDTNKMLKQYESVQREVNNIVGRYPSLAGLAEEATRLLGEAADEAKDPLREFKEEVEQLLEQFGQGNINATSAQLAQLGLALEDALNAGDTELANKIITAMQAIEEQAGLSASAASLLRDENERFTEAAKEQAEAYANYWTDAFYDVSDTVGEFIASGMKDWKDFGKSLLKIVQKIVADIISEFFKLKLINPVLNQIFGTALPTGGAGGLNLASIIAGFGQFLGPLALLAGASTGNRGMGALGGALGGFTFASSAAGAGLIGGSLAGAAGASGTIMGAQLGSVVPVIGTVIGAIVGTLLAGAFEKNPLLRVRSSEFSGDRRSEGRAQSQLGDIFVRTEDLGRGAPTSQEIADKIKEFDDLIAGFLSADQLATVQAALQNVNDTFRDGSANMAEVLEARFAVILGTMDSNIQEFVGSAGTLQERVQLLADALTIAAAADDGQLLTTFEEMAALLTTNRIGTEALSETYTRMVAATQLLEGALALSGISLDLSRVEFIEFANDIVVAAGGLERAGQLWSGFFERFYSEQERADFAAAQARTRATSEFEDIGLNFADFEGEGGMAQFRQLFEEQLPSLSAEAVVAWLEAGNALADLVDITSTYNTVIEESVEAVSSLSDLMSTVESEIAEFGGETQTFSERIQTVNSDLEALVAQATALGAGEKEIARIRELGLLRVNAILDEQRAAFAEYSAYVAQFASSENSGLSQFQTSLQDIAQEASAAATEANRLAVAAGLTGANSADLANIQMRAAEQMAAAALALEASIQSLAEQLGYFEEVAGGGQRDYGNTALGFAHWLADQQAALANAPVIDTGRFDLATQLGRQVRELAEFTGESVTDVLDRMRIPFDRVMQDFGVSIQQLDTPEVFDRFVTASRTLGIEVSEAATRLGVSVGQLADANSQLNNGFERAIARLPTAVGTQLSGLLRSLETAIGPEAQEAARRQLSDFINAQPPAIRDALAPFLDDVDTTSVESQQLAAADQTNRYLSAANQHLERIAANTGRTATAGGPNPLPGEKSATRAELETHRLLGALLTAIQNLEREQRSANIKATVGVNNG